jgi:hypothetical protein
MTNPLREALLSIARNDVVPPRDGPKVLKMLWMENAFFMGKKFPSQMDETNSDFNIVIRDTSNNSFGKPEHIHTGIFRYGGKIKNFSRVGNPTGS